MYRSLALYGNLLVTGLLLILCIQAGGCDIYEGTPLENQPPTVWVASGPPEGSVTGYRIHFRWMGWDSDGDVRYFEYAITDNENGAFDPADTLGRDKWSKIHAYESYFTFTADELADSSALDSLEMVTDFTRSHTFFVRAVDDKGLASAVPAYRSFTAKTLSPAVDITTPATTDIVSLPPITTFRWTAIDYVDDLTSTQDPDSVRWILVSTADHNDDWEATLEYMRKNPDAPEWSKWEYYNEGRELGTLWTTAPLVPGPYVFAVQAKDEAGAVTPVFDELRNVRKVLIKESPIGPLLTARNQHLGILRSNTASTTYTIVDLPAGIPLQFEWIATPVSHQGVVTGYRYGWDITDFGEDKQWDVDWTPFIGTRPAASPPRTYWFGTHTFHVEVMDDSRRISRVNVKINYILFTMDRDLLLVDDYFEDPRGCGIVKTNGAVPCDSEHDAFWIDALQNVLDFDPAIDLIEVGQSQPLSITKLAQYKSVIWDARGGYALPISMLPHLYDLVRFIPEDPEIPPQGKVRPNLLALYLAIGGHVLICGEQPMTMVINWQFMFGPRFPLIYQYELLGDQDGNYEDQLDNPVGDESFAYREMCLDVLEIAYTGFGSLRKPGPLENGCGVTHIRSVRPKEDGLREGLPIDLQFPMITLRLEVAGFGKFFAPENRGLNSEIYNPPYFTCGQLNLGPRQCFEPIYGHGCLDPTSPLYNAPIAVWTTVFDHVIPDVQGGIPARSAVWGFEPYYFNPTAVRQALEVILLDEWQLPRK